MGKMFEDIQIIDWVGTGPVDIDTDRVLDYIATDNYRRALVIVSTAAATAGDDVQFTVRQADSVTGGNVKDFDVVTEYWRKYATTNLLSVAQFTRTTQTADAQVLTTDSEGDKVLLQVLDFELAGMDEANGFNFLGGVFKQDASGGAKNGTCILILYDARYPQAAPVGALV